MSVNTKSANLFYILIPIILLVMLLDRLLPEGMFLDGVTYAAISRNYAIGTGSFWAPYYHGGKAFAEHPPLTFALEGTFFQLMGDHWYTEKVYSLCTWLITLLLVLRLAKLTTGNSKTNMLAIMLWGIVPSVIWSYPNNMLENTMCILDMLAIISMYKALNTDKRKAPLLIAGGIYTLLATLVKGPVGLFPLAFPFIYQLIFRTRRIGQTIISCLIPVLTIATCYLILWQFAAPRQCLEKYLNQQVLAAIGGQREMTDAWGRYAVFKYMLTDLAPMLGITLIIYLLSIKLRNKDVTGANNNRKIALLFILVALSATLPMILSTKQRPYYNIPAFPYFAAGFYALIKPYAEALFLKVKLPAAINKYQYPILTAVILSATVYLIPKAQSNGQNKETIAEVRSLQAVIPKGEFITACYNTLDDWAFLAYLQRMQRSEITFKPRNYAIVDAGYCMSNMVKYLDYMGFTPVPSGSKKYMVFKKTRPALPRPFRRGDI